MRLHSPASSSVIAVLLAVGLQQPVVAEDTVAPAATSTFDLEALVERVRPSIVEVTFTGRDGKRQGLGTGFVIDSDGLIATNLHVLGEARPIRVEFSDGTRHDVVAVHATQRSHDLAILRIDADDLPALSLGKSAEVKTGRRIAVIGNPRGLRNSVTEGVVSARREVDGKPMLQIAVPIEQGNSGGPVLDEEGRVLGIVTLKSLVTRNLGFAVEIDALRPLIEKPNPVPMERWLTIGRLDDEVWTTLFGANWRQRAGRITVSGRGDGFGGRSLCLYEEQPPKIPFEVAVAVRLDDEEGAAGLVLHADGEDKHYGFYPSNGQLRFSRFDGPDVFSWNVLEQIRTPHYRPEEWNTLKVRVEADRMLGFVNGHQVVEIRDRVYDEGKVGLAKFRETEAEFRRFRVAEEIPPERLPAEAATAIDDLVGDISPTRPPSRALVERLADTPGDEGDAIDAKAAHLRERARRLEKQAERLRQLARSVHLERLRRDLVAELAKPEDEIDLLRASLLLAGMDNEEVDVAAYLAQVGRLAQRIRDELPEKADSDARLAALDDMLFEQLGFHGSRTNYYSASNSYLNEVIDDREGLPITLAVLYMELARRLEIPVVGVGLPGHFVVRYEPKEGQSQLVDVFDKGKRLSRKEAIEKVEATAGLAFEEDQLRAQSKREIIERMLQNLLGLARRDEDLERMLECLDTLVALDPDSGGNRFFRAVLRFNTLRYGEALEDTTKLIEDAPDDVDLERVRDLHRALERLSDPAVEPDAS